MPAKNQVSGDYAALRKVQRQARFLLVALIFSVLALVTNVWNGSGNAQVVVKKAVAVLTGPAVAGTVYFAQSSPKGPVTVTGTLRNVSPDAERGFHIHEFGDATNSCASSGPHYNPRGMPHGGPRDATRHVGDLGNVRANSSGIVALDLSDGQISLSGPHSIIGRTVVIHEGIDDLGMGKTAESSKTGNAGGRAGCAVIGIAAN